ncbi:class I SAM-dependent methyltransferase [Streptomyces pactum]|uniref:Class I SAM-dependent methyltransferase n=1 Tax=Streptomyces pactum TaxID=68249 RepID=A0ABS0NRR9_9ACTN|nr:class I SAM-dependent methyltransferase [Streptomyces pactum]MBH5337757.1 class I SAM-dependent methyltransferase [Streptomyces pactum]
MSGHHHHGHHHDTTDLDWDDLGPHLEAQAEISIPLLEQVTDWLRGLTGRDATAVGRVWDVGSGPGVAGCLFATAFPAAEVVAVDGEPALLERARDRAARTGVGDRLRTVHADITDGLPDIGDADLIWSSKALHHVGDQGAAVATLAGRLRPSGVLAVAEGGLPARRLPRDFGIGRPGLEARLDAVAEDWFRRMRAGLPGSRETVEDWPALLTAAGLEQVRSRTFLLDVPAPLDDSVRRFVHADLTRTREVLADELDAEDRATLDRLIDPDDAAGVLRRPDVFLLSAQTVHTGVRPAA